MCLNAIALPLGHIKGRILVEWQTKWCARGIPLQLRPTEGEPPTDSAHHIPPQRGAGSDCSGKARHCQGGGGLHQDQRLSAQPLSRRPRQGTFLHSTVMYYIYMYMYHVYTYTFMSTSMLYAVVELVNKYINGY